MKKIASWLLLATLSGPVWAAATGQVVDPEGQPVAGAEVCEFVADAPPHCITTDPSGTFRIEQPKSRTLLVRAKGFVPVRVEATLITAPVKLRRAASLLVTVIDAVTKKPLHKGKVMINAPSGQRIGDSVPFNQAGVRISTLAPGPVFVRAEADGYQPGGPLAVELASGSERSLTVEMIKASPTSHP